MGFKNTAGLIGMGMVGGLAAAGAVTLLTRKAATMAVGGAVGIAVVGTGLAIKKLNDTTELKIENALLKKELKELKGE